MEHDYLSFEGIVWEMPIGEMQRRELLAGSDPPRDCERPTHLVGRRRASLARQRCPGAVLYAY